MSAITLPSSEIGIFCWYDLNTHDVAAAQQFYTQLLGWSYHVMDIGGVEYPMFMVQGAAYGGIQPIEPGDPSPSQWMAYVKVPDLAERVARVSGLGGKVVVPITEIPGQGHFATIEDATGAQLSLYQPLQPANAKANTSNIGVPAWNELITTDPNVCKTFYASLLDWKLEESSAMPYVLFRNEHEQVGGMLTIPLTTEKSCWTIFFNVANVDDASFKAVELGGKVLKPASDIPGVGRFAVLVDCTGAPFVAYTEFRKAS